METIQLQEAVATSGAGRQTGKRLDLLTGKVCGRVSAKLKWSSEKPSEAAVRTLALRASASIGVFEEARWGLFCKGQWDNPQTEINS